MIFSSFTFLTIFLPLVLIINFLIPKKLSNYFLLLTSLFFYFYGEKNLIILLIVSTLWNFLSALFIDHPNIEFKRIRELLLYVCIIGNLSLLFYYKYLLFFLKLTGLEFISQKINSENLIMPIGISFYTFHGISYVVDIYRKNARATKNLVNLGLYITFFPQLIAGPIIKYHDIEYEIKERFFKYDEIYAGINKFIRGLAKKVLLANNFAFIADSIMNQSSSEISSLSAWIGILFYTLQIYYDFSGYSDMAIGLARIMGFHFKENFNFPYSSRSIKEFWRNWHISLSSWFKEYVYIPLGGNKKKTQRVIFNLLFVFILTGLWHGASVNFLIWGIIHGIFIVFERIIDFDNKRIPKIIKHIYTIFIVIIAWVFFRIETLNESLNYIYKMFSFNTDGSTYYLTLFTPYLIWISILGAVFVLPVKNMIKSKLSKIITLPITSLFHFSLFILSILELSSLSYNPFIYFRF